MRPAKDIDATAINAALDKAGDEVRAVALSGLQAGGRRILADAQDKAPQDTGELRGSGRSRLDPANVRAQIDFTSPYAVIQHEAINIRHGVGGAKFLERALADQADAALEDVARSIRGVLGGR